jgi:hypothetical protein
VLQTTSHLVFVLLLVQPHTLSVVGVLAKQQLLKLGKLVEHIIRLDEVVAGGPTPLASHHDPFGLLIRQVRLLLL